MKIPSLAIASLVLMLSAFPVSAQVAAFNAEMDCGGVFNRGDTVPFTLRLENQTLTSIPLDVTVAVQIPALGSRTIRTASTTLGPNQDRIIDQLLRLPLQAPLGSYTMILTATSPDETVLDTCSFSVSG